MDMLKSTNTQRVHSHVLQSEQTEHKIMTSTSKYHSKGNKHYLIALPDREYNKNIFYTTWHLSLSVISKY